MSYSIVNKTILDPSKIRKPTVDIRNDTSIAIVWSEPEAPGGKNDYYVVHFKQKHKNGNITLEYNRESKLKFSVISSILIIFSLLEARKFVIENCGDGGKFNAFYISVKAVNKIGNTTYDGPWSDELENYCETPINYTMYLLLFAGVLGVASLGFLSTR